MKTLHFNTLIEENRKPKLIDWGFSMYGGYYATVVVNDKVDGLHDETLKGLRVKLGFYGLKATPAKRRDN